MGSLSPSPVRWVSGRSHGASSHLVSRHKTPGCRRGMTARQGTFAPFLGLQEMELRRAPAPSCCQTQDKLTVFCPLKSSHSQMKLQCPGLSYWAVVCSSCAPKPLRPASPSAAVLLEDGKRPCCRDETLMQFEAFGAGYKQHLIHRSLESTWHLCSQNMSCRYILYRTIKEISTSSSFPPAEIRLVSLSITPRERT